MIPNEIIKKTRNKIPLSKKELFSFIENFSLNKVPDYQMSAWCMAVFFQNLNHQEISWLTQAMINSGEKIDFNYLKTPIIDKHSTGGVGDKTSLICTPIIASLGIKVPMISGRGLGHTGGTLDKLESIPGFNVNLDLDTFKKNVEKYNLCFIGQTSEICPADKKIYALRDVTATVDSIPLICSSIMSKKIAEGINSLILDVKCGTGAFMKKLEDARNLANILKNTGINNGINTTALITDMNQPLGKFIGNSLEIKECIDILQNKSFEERNFDFYSDTKELSLHLAAHMIFLAKKASSPQEGYQIAKENLQNYKAWEKFKEIVQVQKGQLDKLPISDKVYKVKSKKNGFIYSFNTEKIGISSVILGAGRLKNNDTIDHTVGIEIHKKIGHTIKKGESIFTIHYNDNDKNKNKNNSSSEKINLVQNMLIEATIIKDKAPKKNDLIIEII